MEAFSGQNLIDFGKVFPDDEACRAYLADLKWRNGFVCKKCGHTSGCALGKRGQYCYKCHHVESATADTLFHRLRFGLHKAFHIIFEMTGTSKGMSSVQIGLRYGIRQKTAWLFMHKVRKAMESGLKFPMKGQIHVDEFVVGGAENGRPGRSYNTKKSKAILAVELTEKQNVKRVYAMPIDDYSSKSLERIFERHLDESASIKTDKWRGYVPLAKKYSTIQVKSDRGRNFKKLHIIVHQIKSWIRTIPTHVGKNHIDAYFNEFCFRTCLRSL